MNKAFPILSLLISCFLVSCENPDQEKIGLNLSKVNQEDFNYRFDALRLVYHIKGTDNRTYRLQCRFLDEEGLVQYSSADFDTLNLLYEYSDTINLLEAGWKHSNEVLEFYSIKNHSYEVELVLIPLNSFEIASRSNPLILEINRSNPDTTLVDNLVLFDIEGEEYELVKELYRKDYVFMFEFATWCGYSKVSIPQVEHIDSVYNELFSIFYIEGSHIYPDSVVLAEFIDDRGNGIPVFIRLDNLALNDILHRDGILSYPRFLLINKNREIIYSQEGFERYLVDSIAYFVENE